MTYEEKQALEWSLDKTLKLDAENVRLTTLIGQIRRAVSSKYLTPDEIHGEVLALLGPKRDE